jgi:hypothetical protein
MRHIALGSAIVSAIGAVWCATITSPAMAVTFGPGDRFQGNALFRINGDVNTSLSFDFLDEAKVSGGSIGNFGISNSTGAFVPYDTDGAINSSSHIIKDTNFKLGSQTDFMKYDDGVGGLDEWSIDLAAINIVSDTIAGKFRFVDIGGQATFKSENIVQGIGGFQGLIKIDRTTQTAQFDFETESVPEPLTILGTGMALGFGGLFKRELAKQKKNSV